MTDRNWTFERAQRVVDDWIGQWDEGYWSPLSNLARLTEEVGELARRINELTGDKPCDDPPASRRKLADEFGDVLFTVVVLANSLEIDLQDALREAIAKYDARDADRFTSSDN